jgi:hypothetical protein
MTVQECINLLNELRGRLKAAGVDDDDPSTLDLRILILQTKKVMIIGGFNPLRQLDDVTIVDISRLRELTQEVAQEIADEQRRIELVQRITATAKMALKAAGLPIPS